MRRIAIGALVLASVLTGCSTISDARAVTGVVVRVGAQNGNFSQDEKRFIQLKDDTTLFVCWVKEEPRCAVVREGDHLSMTVGHSDSYNVENFVVSIDYTATSNPESP